MTIEEVRSKISSFSRFGSRLGLERMKTLLELLDNPQKNLKVFHVTGSNGKGSVSRYVYTVLLEAGLRAGLYTSPYLQRFSERIEYDGAEISDQDLIAACEIVSEKTDIMIARGNDSPTEFEFITAMALWYFAMKKADAVVLEVGLGGRGDSTNVCEKPLVTAITSISLEHTEQLGSTLGEIAYDKAGIIKAGVPVVSFAGPEEARKVIAGVAEALGSKVYTVNDCRVSDVRRELSGYSFRANVIGTDYGKVKLAMVGEHQISNACCALIMLEHVIQSGKLAVAREHVISGMAKAVQHGRFEVFNGLEASGGVPVVIDGAHNMEGMTALVRTLREHFHDGKLLIVTGILRDKKVREMTDIMKTLNGDFMTTSPDNPRRLPAAELASGYLKDAVVLMADDDIERVWRRAMELAPGYEGVICSGSLYLIGRVRTLITGSNF